MNLKSKTYEKKINQDDGSTEFEVTSTYEEIRKTTKSIMDLMKNKETHQAIIDEIDAEIKALEKL